MRKNIVLDLDNVVFDFEYAFCKKFGWEHREFYRLEDRYPDYTVEIELFVTAGKTYRELDILDVGVQIARFCRNEDYKINVVSSRPFYTRDLTKDALEANCVPFDTLDVDNTLKIYKIKKLNPIFVVDDMLDVVERCAEEGIPSFLIDHPWNQKDDLDGLIYRVRSFEEFLAHFTNFFD